jgi:hypothetical protein
MQKLPSLLLIAILLFAAAGPAHAQSTQWSVVVPFLQADSSEGPGSDRADQDRNRSGNTRDQGQTSDTSTQPAPSQPTPASQTPVVSEQPAAPAAPAMDTTPISPIIRASTPTPVASTPAVPSTGNVSEPLLNTLSSSESGVYSGGIRLSLPQLQVLFLLSAICCVLGALLAEQTTLRRLNRSVQILLAPAPLRSPAA